MRQAPEFERHLVRSGRAPVQVLVLGQPRRAAPPLQGAQAHPLKQWKLEPIDMASLDKWDDYTRAKEAMFLHTDTSDAPWTVIKSDCKKRAPERDALPAAAPALHQQDGPSARVDPLLVGRAGAGGRPAEEFTPGSAVRPHSPRPPGPRRLNAGRFPRSVATPPSGPGSERPFLATALTCDEVVGGWFCRTNVAAVQGFHRTQPGPMNARRLGPQGNQHRRNRDARADGHPRRNTPPASR